MKIIIASIKKNSKRLKLIAEKNGFDPVFVSALKVVPLDVSGELNSCIVNKKYSWIVFTSSTAVSLFFKIKRLSNMVSAIKVATVGPATAGYLHRYGIDAAFIASQYTTETLAKELSIKPGSRVMLVRSEDGNSLAEKILAQRGAIPCRLNLYRTSFVRRPLIKSRIEGAKIVVFGSSKEVLGFENRLNVSGIDDFKSNILAAPIGPLTRNTAMELGYRVIDVPKAYTYSYLFAMLGELRDGGRI